jgi:hypothetical protein
MEPESSLACSQEPSTGPYPEPDPSNPYHPILSLLRYSKYQISYPFCFAYPRNLSRSDVRLLMNFLNKLIFYGEELLAPRLSPKLEDHPLSAVRDCLFNIFAATFHIWRPSPPYATWGRAMWWQGTHLTCLISWWLENLAACKFNQNKVLSVSCVFSGDYNNMTSFWLITFTD